MPTISSTNSTFPFCFKSGLFAKLPWMLSTWRTAGNNSRAGKDLHLFQYWDLCPEVTLKVWPGKPFLLQLQLLLRSAVSVWDVPFLWLPLLTDRFGQMFLQTPLLLLAIMIFSAASETLSSNSCLTCVSLSDLIFLPRLLPLLQSCSQCCYYKHISVSFSYKYKDVAWVTAHYKLSGASGWRFQWLQVPINN